MMQLANSNAVLAFYLASEASQTLQMQIGKNTQLFGETLPNRLYMGRTGTGET